MEKCKISVIVPVYNVNELILDCVDSLLKQTHKDLEIILVDDGSQDASAKLCDRLVMNDSRIITIHKKNGGLSDARNHGLRICDGAFVGFVDSDDWVDSKMYETLLEGIHQEKAVSSCRSIKYEDNTQIKTKTKISDTPIEVSGKQALEYLLIDKLGKSVCSKLFDRSLFDDISFPVNRTNEDFAVIYKLLLKSNGVTLFDDGFYHYVKREGSVTTERFNEKQFDKFYNAVEMIEFISIKCPELELLSYQYTFTVISHLCINLVKGGLFKKYYSEYCSMRRFLYKHMKHMFLCPISLKEKISTICIITKPDLYLRLRASN